MNWLIDLLITGLAVWLSAIILPGVTVKNFLTALWVALLLAIVNATIGSILRFLTIPINWITLGLMHFLINVIMILLVDKLVKGFNIKNFGWAVVFAILISIISTVAHWIV
jgi:putative membrane protein